MSDFYSVLTQSIIDRGLRSARDREATYSQARTAMIRRLWSYDPPLAEDEIDARIGQFDLAVDRIENDVVEVFENMPEADEVEDEAPEPAPPLPIIDGYDQDTDYSPTFGGGRPAGNEEPRRPAAKAARERSSLEDLLSTLDIRSLAVEAALNSDSEAPPTADAAQAGVARNDDKSRAYGEEDDDHTEEDDDDGQAFEDGQAYEDSQAYEDVHGRQAYDDRDDLDDEPREPEEAIRTFLPVPVQQARGVTDYYQRAEEAVLVEAPRREARRVEARPASPVPRRRPPAPAMKQSRPRPARRPAADSPPSSRPARKGLSGGQRLGLLIGAVGALAVALIGLTAYILLPATNAPTIVAQAPPATSGAGALVAQPKGMPPPVEGSLRRFVIFDGSDPTVFETDPSNPVRFDGRTARIATSAGSAGAKALVGPGLASRLGGHTVSVTIMARTARENGTANLRFALQSGLAVSYWKTASLTEEFVPIVLTWRVPTLRTDPAGDAIIIEPGIPGDSTGAEIGAIVIDMLD